MSSLREIVGLGKALAPKLTPQEEYDRAINQEQIDKADEDRLHTSFIAAKQVSDAYLTPPNVDGLDATAARKVEKDHASRKEVADANTCEAEATWKRAIEIRKKSSRTAKQSEVVLNHAADGDDAVRIVHGMLEVQQIADRMLERASRSYRTVDTNLIQPIAIVFGPNGLLTGLCGALKVHQKSGPAAAPKSKAPPTGVFVRFIAASQGKRESAGINEFQINERAHFPKDRAQNLVRLGVAEIVETVTEGATEIIDLQ